MALTLKATSSNVVSVKSDTIKEVSQTVNLNSEGATQRSEGIILIPIGASADVIPIGNIDRINYIWLQVFRDDGTTPDNLAAVILSKLVGSITLPDTHALEIMVRPKSASDIDAITVNGNASRATIVKYLILGDKI